MKQLISYYRMPGDREEEISRLIHAEGLDGVENLISVSYTHLTLPTNREV